MKKSYEKYKVIFAIAFGYFAILAAYLFWWRKLVVSFFEGAAPEWFAQMVHIAYPRLSAEVNRLPAAFFLEKADQVIFRLGLVATLAAVWLFLLKKFSVPARQSFNWWFGQIPIEHFKFLSALFMLSILFFMYDWDTYLIAHSEAVVFYRPIWLYKWLGIGFPSAQVAFWLHKAAVLAAVMVFFNIRPVFFSISLALLFLGMLGFLFSFEKIDHHYATFGYGLMLLPFGWQVYKTSRGLSKSQMPGWPLRLIQVAIALAYCLSGLEKLVTSKLAWLKADAIQNLLATSTMPHEHWLLTNEVLVQTIALGVMVFQVGFISVLFIPRVIPFFLVIGGLFHFFTGLLFGIGGLMHPWVFMYLFFIPPKITQKLRKVRLY